MDQSIPTSKRPTVREIATDGMMMHYTDPQIIKEQIAALKNLGLMGDAMESIEVHNPVLAAAISSKLEHFIDYEQMAEKASEYSYDGSDGGRYISQTYTWVARLHYELQTVALYGLMETLETGELSSEQLADFTVALGDTTVVKNGFLAFNFNPDRQPRDFFGQVAERLFSMGFGVEDRGHDRFYRIPGFLWNGLNAEQRGRLAIALIYRELDRHGESFEDKVLRRGIGDLLATVFAWNKELNAPGLIENSSKVIDYDGGDRFLQGRVEFTADGFLWIEELRGLTSAR